jgi:hypothetical protein
MTIDEDVAARMVAVLCASILSASAGEKDHVKVLATSDIYLDFIRPAALRVSRQGKVDFVSEEKGKASGKTTGRRTRK